MSNQYESIPLMITFSASNSRLPMLVPKWKDTVLVKVIPKWLFFLRIRFSFSTITIEFRGNFETYTSTMVENPGYSAPTTEQISWACPPSFLLWNQRCFSKRKIDLKIAGGNIRIQFPHSECTPTYFFTCSNSEERTWYIQKWKIILPFLVRPQKCSFLKIFYLFYSF